MGLIYEVPNCTTRSYPQYIKAVKQAIVAAVYPHTRYLVLRNFAHERFVFSWKGSGMTYGKFWEYCAYACRMKAHEWATRKVILG